MIEGKDCTKCGQYKDYSEYNNYRGSKDGKMSYCKECAYSYNKVYAKENSNLYIASNKRFRNKLPGGVYRIKTTIGDYIGESKHMKFRISQHLIPSNTDTPVTKEVFKEWEVLEYIEDPVQRLIREAYWIDKLKPKLNKRLVKERV